MCIHKLCLILDFHGGTSMIESVMETRKILSEQDKEYEEAIAIDKAKDDAKLRYIRNRHSINV